MASKPKNWVDPAMAAFAGGAIAFLIIAMPEDAFEALVALTGLPGLVAAAQPPLGATARMLAAAAAGLAVFGAIWALLRALSAPRRPKPRISELAEVPAATPRLRRADAHPDAPARRPLFAGVDLADPAEEAPQKEAQAQPAAEPIWQRAAEEPAPAPEPMQCDEAEPDVAQAPELEPQPQPEPAPIRLAEPRPAPSEETIAALVERLERGLARRGAGDAPAPAAVAAAAPEEVDRRLRSALDDLQRLAARPF